MPTPAKNISYRATIDPLIWDLLDALRIEGAIDENDNLIPGSSLILSAGFDLTTTKSFLLVDEITHVVYKAKLDPVEAIAASARS